MEDIVQGKINNNNYTVEDIVINIKENFKIVGNPTGKYFNNIAASELINRDSLDWVNTINKKKLDYIEKSKATIIVCDKTIESELKNFPDKCFIVVNNPKSFIHKIYNVFFKPCQVYRIEKTANISIDAKLSKKCYIGANVNIGKAEIGENTYISANVFIDDNVIIGNNVYIQPGCIIGTAGFGFIKEDEQYKRFPQIGKVIIKDYVEIGCNTTIDRGSLSDTIIGEGTKIDNLVQIAHNVKIGANCIITGGVRIGGSTKIGDNVWIGPGANVIDNISIGNNVIIGIGAAVFNSLSPDHKYIGNPATTIENFVKNRIKKNK